MAVSSAPAFSGVGPYQVVRYLGHGPVAAAYLCHKMDAPDGLYVMSIVHDDLSIHRWLVEQLLAEVADCARVQHPNVESIVEFGTVEQHGYVVTRHIEGCALSRLLLLCQGEIPLRVCLPLIVDVLRGLHAAHSLRDARDRPIVHSGVVPACILVGLDGIARVAEFGIARVQMRTTQTMPGVRIDRFAHLAPEQIRQSGEVDLPADIFAVGTILWSLATGESLFGVGDSVATMYRVLHHQPPGPSGSARRPPAWLDAICLRALQKEPTQRYASAEEMASELQSRAIVNKSWAPRSEVIEWLESALVNADAILPPQLPPRAPSGLSFQRIGGSDGLRISGTGPKATGPKAMETGAPPRRRAPVIIAFAVMAVLALGVLALIIGNRHLTLRFATEPQISSSVVLSPPPSNPASPVETKVSPPSQPPETKPADSKGAEAAPSASAAKEVAREQQTQVSSSPPSEGTAPVAVRPAQVRAKPSPPSVPKSAAPTTPSVSANAASTAPSTSAGAPAEAPSKPFFPPVENNPYLRHSH